MSRGPTRVLVVDDTASIRAMLRAVIAEDRRLSLAGEAGDPFEARNLIKALMPDVVTLDIEMPRMNGLAFLEKIMRLRPLPVVMVSTRTRDRSAEAIRAMALGAVDCVDVAHLTRPEVRRRLADTLVMAGGATVGALGAGQRLRAAPEPGYVWGGATVLIGSSTGGVDAIERVLAAYPADGPPTVIAQHMPPAFLRSFARRLDQSVAPSVAIAEDGETLRAGRVLLAGGGDAHATLSRGSAGATVVRLVPSTAGDTYVPAIDRLFHSATDRAEGVVAALLTGMGRDGADGLLALRKAGARTIAQDGPSCVIDGMPRAARDIGAAEMTPPLARIGETILALTAREGAAAR